MRKPEEWVEMHNDHAEQLLRAVALDTRGNDLMQYADDLDGRDMPSQYRGAWETARELYLSSDPFTLDSFRGVRGIDLEVLRANVISAPVVSSTPKSIEKLKADLRDAGRRLRAQNAGILFAEEALDPRKPIEEIEEAMLGRVMENGPSVANVVPLNTAISTVLELGYAYHLDPALCRGYRTGFDKLDNLMNGVERSQYMVVAGRPGMGKSALAFQMAVGMARYGSIVLLASLENTLQSVVARMVAQQAGVSAYRYKLGLNDEEWDKFEAAGEKLAALAGKRIFIADTGGLSIRDIMLEGRKIQRDVGDLTSIIVDTLNKTADARGDNLYSSVTNASLAFHDGIRALDVGGVAVVQLNRAPASRADKEPTMADIRDSGAVEQDADKILIVDREDYWDNTEPTHLAKLKLEKHRDGPTGTTYLYYEEEWPGYRPATSAELLAGGVITAESANETDEQIELL